MVIGFGRVVVGFGGGVLVDVRRGVLEVVLVDVGVLERVVVGVLDRVVVVVLVERGFVVVLLRVVVVVLVDTSGRGLSSPAPVAPKISAPPQQHSRIRTTIPTMPSKMLRSNAEGLSLAT